MIDLNFDENATSRNGGGTASAAAANTALAPNTNLLNIDRGYDDSIRVAIEMSKRDEEERRHRQEQEDEELRRILELSLVEK